MIKCDSWRSYSKFFSYKWDTHPVFNFNLTLTNLALRICKFEGGPRMVTYLGEKIVSWPKDLSNGLKNLKKGLFKPNPWPQ